MFKYSNENMKEYELLEHTADLKIKAYGKDLPELFSNILKGMFENCRPILDNSQSSIDRKINIKSENLEALLIDFLSEALYLSDVNNEVYFQSNFKILTNNKLIGKIVGKKVERLGLEIKAVTWYDLKVKKENNLWTAVVLFDI